MFPDLDGVGVSEEGNGVRFGCSCWGEGDTVMES